MNQATTPSTARHTVGAIRPATAGAPSTTGAPRGRSDKPVTEYDALTELFLGDGCLAPGPTGQTAATRILDVQRSSVGQPVIEALVLGHLPVLASAWVGQYAKHVAQGLGGPVALLRVRAGSVALDLVGGPSKKGAPDREPFGELGEAIRDAAAQTDRWIMSVEATSEPRVAAMLGAGGIDTLTLLTGADETAVVACYRTIKSLLGKQEEREDVDDGSSPARVQLGVMGATQEKASEAGDKLAHASETFLGRRPEVVACVSKIGGSVSRPLYRGSDERMVEDVVAMIRESGGTARRRAQTREAAPTPSSAAPTPRLVSAPTVSPVVGIAPATTSGRIGMPLVESHAPNSSERTARLTGHLAGLTPVRFRCPYAARVELAKSSDGRLHLLAQTDDGSPLGAAVAHLAGAAAWAKAHADLLMAACPGLVMNVDSGGPISHVFTDRAPGARSVLDSEVRVHLLTPVRADGSTAWVCVDLN